MKTNFWIGLTVAACGGLLGLPGRCNAQPPHTAPPAAPPQFGPAIVTAKNVNVRGQPTIRSEVITRLNQGDAVVVLEKITRTRPAPGEPAEWARIAFPTNAHVWVHAQFIDPTNKTVLPRRLNLRAGPGENYSVVGTLERGQTICEVLTRDNWIQIVPPTNAYAFVAAQYLRQEPATPTPALAEVAARPQQATTPAEPEPAPVIEPVTPALQISAVPSQPTIEPGPTQEPTPAPEQPTAPAPAPEEQLQPPSKRIVQREGIVRPSLSIQAPTPFALVSPDTGQIINYLHTTATNLNLRRYRGLRIIVTGEEGLDRRWTNTPVLTIQRIYVVE